ncbi:MAG: tRNA(Ile)(2)-agmatinylcytidine synthase [Desulfurococcales archaeon]|nr:tRNA(Ile)(2)-agmatinylcytidine synthase [Desulfurococcales archaeon]
MEKAPLVSVAVDDVDSPWGGCTTHFSGLLLKRLLDLGVELADYPLLVRLNPGIPWKTRGNAAVVLRVRGLEPKIVMEEAVSLVDEYAGWRREPGKGPGVVVLEGSPWDPKLRWLYRKALTSIVVRDVALKVIESVGGLWFGGRGVVGAASSIAALAPGDDYTWELTAYRRPDVWGSPRCIDHEAAARVEARLPPCTFNNYDLIEGKFSAAPQGPDPVLAGFRGDCPWALKAYSEVLCEKPHFWVLYRSNQHTDAPAALGLVAPPRPYNYVVIEGLVGGKPEVLPGSHIIVRVLTGEFTLEAAFYNEAYPLNKIASRLAEGDRIVIQGSVRPYRPRGYMVVAVDKLVVKELAPLEYTTSPPCPRCGKRMKSAGRGKGYKCPSCGYKLKTRPIHIDLPRRTSPGIYAPREGRLRHLTAPPGRKPKRWKPPGKIEPSKTVSWSIQPPG